MADNERFEESIGGWLEEAAPSRLPGRVLDATFERTRRTRQETAWRTVPGRLQMPRFIPALGGAAVVVLAAALVLNIIRIPGFGGQPTPTPSASAPSALAYGVDGDVFLADADGSNAVRIADGVPVGGPEECAAGDERAGYVAFGRAWSPDGRYLAYWDRGCRWWVRDAKDDPWGIVRITDAAGNLVASFPGQGWMISWSPDSTRVAVMEVWDGPGERTIGVFALTGIREAALTVPSALKESGVGDYSPVWSRDGSSILVRNMQVPLDGGAPTLFPEVRPFGAYSPDGSRYAYVDRGSLVVEDADEPDATKVSGALNEYSSAAWSPNGDLVAFEGDGTELLVRNVATGGDTSLLDVTLSEHVAVLEFSPDGERIVFMRSDAETDSTGGLILSNSSLWSIGTDGSDLLRLVDRIDWADLRPLGRPS